eukprot:TRINITY_DN5507_c0_g1_i2.p1 TRINITY_DN5507_c0_g1~~TRINITY_DN5507_c0_g1_i2.p1  ORF type:complete len:136 (+),score=8.76 TRINITY_DN5507_c0_g1_i2:49-456(+)
MGGLCRWAAVVVRSKTLGGKPMPCLSFLACSSMGIRKETSNAPSSSRSVVVVVAALKPTATESLMPLHSVIASARLKSMIAAHSTYWSCLSQVHSTQIEPMKTSGKEFASFIVLALLNFVLFLLFIEIRETSNCF